MESRYDGLPAAASFEQAIIRAQVLILKDLERAARSRYPGEPVGLDSRLSDPPKVLPRMLNARPYGTDI
jgi:hypothetical protein